MQVTKTYQYSGNSFVLYFDYRSDIFPGCRHEERMFLLPSQLVMPWLFS
jgi:hypothetical protein